MRDQGREVRIKARKRILADALAHEFRGGSADLVADRILELIEEVVRVSPEGDGADGE